jgi:hypothetical protein
MARSMFASFLLNLSFLALSLGSPASEARYEPDTAVSSHLRPVLEAINRFAKPIGKLKDQRKQLWVDCTGALLLDHWNPLAAAYHDVSLQEAFDQGLLCPPSAAVVILKGPGRPAR